MAGLGGTRALFVDSYVPGVFSTTRTVVGPGRLTLGTTLHEAAQLLAVVRFAEIPGPWVYVGVVERDGVIGLGDGATSERDARRLETEQIAFADVLVHVLGDSAEAPYR